MTYFDTSFFLGAILNQHPEIDYDTYWHGDGPRVSSHLLNIEVFVSLGRISSLRPQFGNDWLKGKLASAQHLLAAVTIKYVDSSIEDAIRDNLVILNCRTLDAIHLATALYFQAHTRDQIRLCSLDKRMRTFASDIGFSVVPESLA